MEGLRLEKVNLGVLLILAFFLRVLGLGYGLPELYHQDEPIVVNHALALGVTGPNPHFFVLPGFIIYFVFLLSAVFFLTGRVLGFFSDSHDFAIEFLRDPTAVYLLNRFFVGVFFGVFTVWIVYRAGERIFDKKAGWLAALFLSVCYLHVRQSHFIYVDIPLTLAAAFLVFSLYRLMREGSWRNYLFTGAVLGWGMATKYTMAYFFPSFLLAHILAEGKDRGVHLLALRPWTRFLGACAFSVAVFLLLSPYTLLAWPEFLGQLIHQAGSERSLGWFHHLHYSLIGGLSLPLSLLSVFGACVHLRQDVKGAGTLLFLALSFYMTNTLFGQPFERYMLPLVPLLCLWAGRGWEGLETRYLKKTAPRRIFLGLVVSSLLIPSLYSDFLMLREDTRSLSKAWFEEHVPQGTVVVLASRTYAPRLYPSAQQILEKYGALREEEKDLARRKRLDLMNEALEGRKRFEVYTVSPGPHLEERSFLFQRPFVPGDPLAIKSLGARYIVFHTSERIPFFEALKEKLKPRLRSRVAFSPYWSDKKMVSLDPYDATSGPHLARELFSRKRLGPFLEVYEII